MWGSENSRWCYTVITEMYINIRQWQWSRREDGVTTRADRGDIPCNPGRSTVHCVAQTMSIALRSCEFCEFNVSQDILEIMNISIRVPWVVQDIIIWRCNIYILTGFDVQAARATIELYRVTHCYLYTHYMHVTHSCLFPWTCLSCIKCT